MIAALPMYDFPQLRMAHATLWAALAERLRMFGVEKVPTELTHTGDNLESWRDPALLFGQACEFPLTKSHAGLMSIVATPCYTAAGCEGAFYRSAIIVRREDEAYSLEGLRRRRCVINDPESNSGMNLLRAAIAPIAHGSRFFESVRVSGAHWRSVEWVASGAADLAAIDCVTFAHMQSYEPKLTEQVRLLAWTPMSPCLPFVTGRRASSGTLQALRTALMETLADPSLAWVRDQLRLRKVEILPGPGFARVRALERAAAEQGYPELA